MERIRLVSCFSIAVVAVSAKMIAAAAIPLASCRRACPTGGRQWAGSVLGFLKFFFIQSVEVGVQRSAYDFGLSCAGALALVCQPFHLPLFKIGSDALQWILLCVKIQQVLYSDNINPFRICQLKFWRTLCAGEDRPIPGV